MYVQSVGYALSLSLSLYILRVYILCISSLSINLVFEQQFNSNRVGSKPVQAPGANHFCSQKNAESITLFLSAVFLGEGVLFLMMYPLQKDHIVRALNTRFLFRRLFYATKKIAGEIQPFFFVPTTVVRQQQGSQRCTIIAVRAEHGAGKSHTCIYNGMVFTRFGGHLDI